MKELIREYQQILDKLNDNFEELQETGFEGASKEAFYFMRSLLSDHIGTVENIIADLKEIDEGIYKGR